MHVCQDAVFLHAMWCFRCCCDSTCAAEVLCSATEHAAPQCGWAGLMLKLYVGWREKRASSIACFAPVFLCRIVLIKRHLFDACSLLRIVKLLPAICHTHHPLSQSTRSTEQHSLTRCARSWRKQKLAGRRRVWNCSCRQLLNSQIWCP